MVKTLTDTNPYSAFMSFIVKSTIVCIALENVKIISFAGNTPPISCMNDGLQVSTGATIGHGLITIEATAEAYPGAIFIAEGAGHGLAFPKDQSGYYKAVGDFEKVWKK